MRGYCSRGEEGDLIQYPYKIENNNFQKKAVPCGRKVKINRREKLLMWCEVGER